MDMLQTIPTETARMLYLAAPFLLLGLAMAGLVHVLMPSAWIERWMGKPGLKGAALAAGLGVPLPVCSCGVVPLAVEMRRKKASDPASMAFLITTPESGADSVLFTWGLMGPVMAIARPVSAFVTAMIGAVLAILRLPANRELPRAEAEEVSCCGGCGSSPDEPSDEASDEAETQGLTRPGIWRRTVRPALSYGFGELFDDLAFWLVLGLVFGGVLTALLPGDLSTLGLGSGFLPMLVMLVVGIPLYMCASASTPVAAALMAKGLSPGAALVFLLAGPATNAAALVVLTRTFGRQFIQIYLISVSAGALICGLALDAVITFFGLSLILPIAHAHDHGLSPIGIIASILLTILLIRAAQRGAFASGWRELMSSFRPGKVTEHGAH